MKNWVNGLFSSISMFSILPAPKLEWEDSNIKYILMLFPITGLILGFIYYCILSGLVLVQINPLIKAFLLMIAPFVLTGFIHVDGFSDTCDAWLSRRDLETRRKILKDSNIGVFAACGMILLFMLHYICALTMVNKQAANPLIILLPVISRSVASFSIMKLKAMSENGLGALFKAHSSKNDSLFVLSLALLAFAGSYLLKGAYGILFCAVTALGSAIAAFSSYKSFEGFSGDLAGFSIIIGEAAGLIMLAL